MVSCPNCKSDNPIGAKFCNECGEKITFLCPFCHKSIPQKNKFCNECGKNLCEPEETTSQEMSNIGPDHHSVLKTIEPEPVIKNNSKEGERRYATVLFSDLSGYTAMSEKLDPEEVKELMGRIFGEITRVVTKYEGHIEKFIGDAFMAIFGVPKSHEDDAIRAIIVAREIHTLVANMSPFVEKRIGRPLAMHSGINTGLVVTGEMDIKKGVLGIIGDTINVAARLEGLAKGGQIFIGYNTRKQAGDRFVFEEQEPAKVKGKKNPLRVYKVLDAQAEPIGIKGLQGVRSKLVGRKMELSMLKEIADSLESGEGSIISLSGDAGTGKSRLIEELKNSIRSTDILWLQGHAYPYAQNISYFSLIDLLNQAFKIREGDSPEKAKRKIKESIHRILPNDEWIVPILEVLYSLQELDKKEINPQFWMLKLRESVQKFLIAMAHRSPIIICLEDLHWADPSSLELITAIMHEGRHRIVFLCAYRPTITLFNGDQKKDILYPLHEIQLKEFSLSESHEMVESLLNTETIPSDLRNFIESKTEGNPFYLEEMINSMIESGSLVNDNGTWQIDGKIKGSDISSKIHGVITTRIDRLKTDSKQVLQEASVIGRSFYLQILRKITKVDETINECLDNLKTLDLVKERANDPDLEYIFKHALTQEVVYNGLLRKERQTIHERIGLVMEEVFKERRPEFYETLAYHFTRSGTTLKAIEYLIKSGEKSRNRYAVTESHQYFLEAYNILKEKGELTQKEKTAVLQILTGWARTLYYIGDFKFFVTLFQENEALADAVDDSVYKCQFLAWWGLGLYNAGKYNQAYKILRKGLKLSTQISETQTMGLCCISLAWTCSIGLGTYDEGASYAHKAMEIAKQYPEDLYLYFKPLTALCFTQMFKGEVKACQAGGKKLIEFGEKTGEIRSKAMGHWALAYSHYTRGDYDACIQESQKGIDIAIDPYYKMTNKQALGNAYLMLDDFDNAEEPLRELFDGYEKFEIGAPGFFGIILYGACLLSKGEMKKGIELVKGIRRKAEKEKFGSVLIIAEYILGTIFLRMLTDRKSITPQKLFKNIGFIIRNTPTAAKKSEHHLKKAIDLSKGLGARGWTPQILFELATLHRVKGRIQKARECYEEAIQLFELNNADVWLARTQKELASLPL